jgi:hypothetical protein
VIGPVKIEKTSTTSAIFPIGKINGTDTLFAPVSLLPVNAIAKIYTAEYFPQPYSDLTAAPPIDHVSKLEYWHIHSDLNSTDADAKVTLSWRPYSEVGDGTAANNTQALADLVISHYFDDGTGQKWNMDGNTPTFTTVSLYGPSNLSYGFITQLNSTSTSFFADSIFTLGTKSKFNLLPVKLIKFSAVPKNNLTQLSWTTEEERSMEKYEIERSSDGINFSLVIVVNSLQKFVQWNYSALDFAPLEGLNYYRLKIIDTKNKSYYSNIVKVWFGITKQLIVYPNPACKEINIKIPYPSSISTLEIVNSSGNILRSIQTADSSITINIQSLRKGMYFIRFRNQMSVISQRFFKR